VVALLMPAITALGSHGTTRFRPCLRMTNWEFYFCFWPGWDAAVGKG
jgi:hypothetical protein